MKAERNRPCGCGSGKKYKKCCWGKEQSLAVPTFTEKMVSSAGSAGQKDTVASFFETYNSDNLLASIAGLTLIGENHGKNYRLEELTANILVDYNQNIEQISDEKLREVLDAVHSSHYMEDLPVNLFSDLISFHGGDFIVFPGICEDTVFMLSNLVKMLFLQNHKQIPNEFISKCRQSVHFILELSNSMARKLGINRYQRGEVNRGKISFPDAALFAKLRDAVKITAGQMAGLQQMWGISDEVRDAFLINRNDPTLAGRFGEESNLPIKPLFKGADGYVIISPATLTYALVDYIRQEAERMGVSAPLRQEFHREVFNDMQPTLKRLGFNYIDMQGRGLKLFPESLGALYQFDDNKIAYIHLHTADAELQKAKVLKGSTVLEEALKLKEFQGFETFEIAMLSGLGENHMMMHNGNKTGRTLLLRAGELEVLSGIEKLSAVGLYKYALSSAQIGMVMPGVDFLDRFQVYKENKESFYVSDEQKDVELVIEPGYGQGIFAESRLSLDVHSVESRLDGQPVLIEVARKDKYAPVYMSASMLMAGKLFMLVEGFAQSIWVTAVNVPKDLPGVREMYFQVADAIAYWLWQIQERIAGILSALGRVPLMIDFELLEPAQWNNIEQTPAREGVISEKFHLELRECRLFVGVPAQLLAYLGGAQNEGDRILVEMVLRALNLKLQSTGLAQISDQEIKDIIDDRAPLGLKKKFFLLDSNHNRMIDKRNLDGYRYVQEHDVSWVLDQIGSMLGEKAPAVGTIANQKEKEKFLFSVTQNALLPLLRSKLAFYNSAELIKRLLTLNEGLINHREYLRIHTPTLIACYVGEKKQQEDLLKEVGALNEATVSVRCLIEHIAAEPYHGTVPVSQTAVDELLAIMSQIVSTGTVSDLIHFGLLDMEVGMLGSGRMGSDKSVLRNIYDPFHEVKAKENVSDAIETFDRAFAGEVEEAKKPVPEAVEKAFLKDFGISLTRIMDFTNALVHIGFMQETANAEIPLSELNAKINDVLVDGFAEGEFKAAIACLTLVERGKLENLPKEGGYEYIDIMPWRFNRMLSLMRRPLVINGKNGSEVVNWGPRQVIQSQIYYMDQLVSGRFRNPEGSAVAGAIGKFANERGDALVAAVLQAIDPNGLIIDHDVYINENAPFFHSLNIGDVDVLIIDVKNRILYSLECKAMSPSRNGKEMVEELSKLFSGDDAWVGKHIKREDWLKANLDKFGKAYNVDLTGFEVKSFFVTVEEMIAPHARKGELPMPFITLYDLQKEGFAVLSKDFSHQLKK